MKIFDFEYEIFQIFSRKSLFVAAGDLEVYEFLEKTVEENLIRIFV